MDELGSVGVIATVYGKTVGERSRYIDCLRIDGLGSVEFIATGYGWTCRGS